MIIVTAPLWLWNGEKGSWHFITVPESQSAEIRLQNLRPRRRVRTLNQSGRRCCLRRPLGTSSGRTTSNQVRRGRYQARDRGFRPARADSPGRFMLMIDQ